MWRQWQLPTTSDYGGINTDYRDILDIIMILQNSKIAQRIKVRASLQIFYEDYEKIEDVEGAIAFMMLFISCGEMDEEKAVQPKQFDWEQDYMAIVCDINNTAKMEIRAIEYLHWFTFISYFNGIGEGQLSQLVGIRNKLRKGEKLEKYEREFYTSNKSRVVLKEKYTAEEQEELARYLEMLGE